MLDECLRLVTTLNQLSVREVTAAEAEARISAGQPHHVFDADSLLGLDPLAQVPLRQALARLDHGALGGADAGRPVWALLLPRPGRMAGLRGPRAVSAAALAAGAVVMSHDGQLAWLGERVGHGVQWRLARAERPVPPTDPREAAGQFTRQLAQAAQALAGLDLTAGLRPDEVHAPVLPDTYPRRSQQLLDRAWLVLSAVELALEAQPQVLHSHGVLTRERHLRELADAALDAIGAAASWPGFAME